jgi:hypothetical protein
MENISVYENSVNSNSIKIEILIYTYSQLGMILTFSRGPFTKGVPENTFFKMRSRPGESHPAPDAGFPDPLPERHPYLPGAYAYTEEK